MGTTINERFISLIETLSLNTNSFAKAIGKSYTAVESIVKGKTRPSYDVLAAVFSKYPEVNPDWLLNDKGEMFRLPKKPADGGTFGEQVITDMAKNIDDLKHVFEEELRAKNRQIDNLQEMLKMALSSKREQSFPKPATRAGSAFQPNQKITTARVVA